MKLKFMKVREVETPTYGTEGAACFCFYAPEDISYIRGERQKYGDKIPLGIAVEVPKGYVLLILPRSSIGVKTLLRKSNSVGVIDSDYRVEICSIYDYLGYIRKGERIAQGFLLEIPKVELEEVEKLSETERGTGGFGSTGK